MRAHTNAPNIGKNFSQATDLLRHLENLQDTMTQDFSALGAAVSSSKHRKGGRWGTSITEGPTGKMLQGNSSTMLKEKLFLPSR